ncbi:MAG: ABC transporter permease [Chloroflexota bacterium]|nr:ABC transporter permease [Chloroflexota bacterium]
MDTLTHDVGLAARRLGGQRGFTLAALLTLALGIGANTSMFGIVYGLLLRPLPYPDPEGIVHVGEASGLGRWMLTNRSMPLLQDAEWFEHLAAYRESSVAWTSPYGTVTLRDASVSPALFPLLRATPHLGRLFAEEEARAGADRVVLLSHRAWTNHFASDPDIVGAVLDLNGELRTMVGVLSEGFYFPTSDSEFCPFVVPPFTPPVVAAGEQPR